ncbi:MAG: ral secretion pathway protein [Proteobacteria bacterium]|nr:ral secretion pathway protein [Pseudomonadota bacterium]
MRRPSVLIAAGTAAFLVFLVAFLPASLLLRFLPPGVSLEQVSGTVWWGRAESVAVNVKSAGGFRNVGAVRWHNRPWRLPLLDVDYAVELRPAGGLVELDVTVGRGGTVTLGSVTGNFPLQAVDGLFAPAGWKGTVELDVERLTLVSGFPRSAAGVMRVQDLTAPGTRGVNIGGFELTLGEGAVGSDVITGRLRDLGGGAMQVRGTLELKPDRSYLLSGEVAPGPEATAAISRTLSFLGPPDSLGRRPFAIEGTL